MEERYKACMILHALGDTIGFKNSEWEFIGGAKHAKTFEKINEFVYLGGINYIPEKDWVVSDDTIMHMKTAQSLVSNFSDLNELYKLFLKNYVDALNQFEEEGYEKRWPGKTLLANLMEVRKTGKWGETKYDYFTGGSGASMRTSCIGLAFYGEEYRSLLLEVSIESSRITHTSSIGYLGGFTSAYFTALAIEGVEIKKWPFYLLKMFETDTILKYIEKKGRDVDEHMKDSLIFVDKWHRYTQDKFDEEGNVVRSRAKNNLLFRTDYYYKNFGFEEGKETRQFFPGSGGDDSVIIAYDALIDAGKSWETLVFYSMMHGGDTDTTGCIAASWYGVLYGFGDVPMSRVESLEFKDEITKLSDGLYKKYYSERRLNPKRLFDKM